MTRQIRPVQPSEIDQGINLLFSDLHGALSHSDDFYSAFMATARRDHYDLSRQIVLTGPDGVLFTCLFTPGPGRIATIYASNPANLTEQDKESAVRALIQLCQWANQTDCVNLQTILEQEDSDRRDMFLRSGYRFLTQLDYLYRIVDISAMRIEPLNHPSHKWLPYSREIHPVFRQTIQATYHDSLDCPELNPIRTIDEAIESHQAYGRMEPDFWQLLLVDNQPAGVLLLSDHTSDALDLIYMGVLAGRRGHRLGYSLVQQAMQIAAQHNKKMITLAVDVRNHHAKTIYERFGFKTILTRSVMLYSSRWSAPDHADSR